jgi:Tol biopolymer transport system component
MQLPDGSRKTLDGSDKPVSLIISEKSCVLRTGTKILADMSYTLDTKPDPWTIDMKSKDGALAGICVIKGNGLQICLNDAAESRPRDFDPDKHGIVLVLQRYRRTSLVVMNADGSNPHAIVTMPDYTFVGSPKWSHDGTKIAFDAARKIMGDNTKHVFVVNADGSAPKDLGPGAVPSWSPDDKQLTFSRPGIWIVNADGSGHADGTGRRQIDTRGFGSQWSPKGDKIAYTTKGEDDKAFCIYDVSANRPSDLLQTRYREIFWGGAWSPDGKWLCCKGLLPDGSIEIGAISAEGEEKGFRVLLPSSAQPEVLNSDLGVSWGGDGKQILIAMQKSGDRGRRLYILDSEGARPPRLFPNFPPGWTCNNPCWSPDGKKVVMSADPDETQPQNANAVRGGAGITATLTLSGLAPARPVAVAAPAAPAPAVPMAVAAPAAVAVPLPAAVAPVPAVAPVAVAAPVAEVAPAAAKAPAKEAPAAGVVALNLVPAAQPAAANQNAEANTLDLSSIYLKDNPRWPILESFSGRQVVDGLPFQIDGQMRAYGKTPEAHGDGAYRLSHKGIRIGRKFDYLYLIHHAACPDAEGATIAYVILNYADGTEHIIPIRYGVHVRDWYNMPSYEKEAITDPDTTICWRREPASRKAPIRLFESRFENPSPEKEVTSMDIVSARSLAAYCLLAATVSNHRSKLPAAKFSGDRNFDGRVVIRVVDANTGRPIAGATVLPGMTVQDEGVIGSPFYSSSAGKGTIPYPTKDTSNIDATAEKKGYQSEATNWESPFPETFTFRLKPLETESR